MRIVFRVDASNRIGTGHVMRCLTLANELKLNDVDVEFVTRETEENLSDFISSKGYKVHILKPNGTTNEEYCFHSAWLESSWQNDVEETISVTQGADWLIVDHYAIDERWEKKIRPHVKKIMLIDDLADRKHDCDLLLDQNYYQDMQTRYDGLCSAQKLLGPNYALLRPEFKELRKAIKPRSEIRRILISFGGVDADDYTLKSLEQLKDFAGEVDVVVATVADVVEPFGVVAWKPPELLVTV